MDRTCDKCFTCIPEENFVRYAHVGVGEQKFNHIDLCIQCNILYSRTTEGLLFEFLKDDYGNFPIGRIDRNMLEARKSRSKKWADKSRNVAKDSLIDIMEQNCQQEVYHGRAQN